jgi:hypothetical protein
MKHTFRGLLWSLTCILYVGKLSAFGQALPGSQSRTEYRSGSSHHHGDVQYMPMRDIYFFGAGGTRTVAADYTMAATDGIIKVDASAADVTITLLPYASIPNQRVHVQKLDAGTHTVTVQTTAGDTFSDGSTSRVLAAQGDFTSVTIPGV